MSLTKEKILKNAKKFNETGVKYGFVNDELMNLLGPEFIGAPACSTNNLYNAFEGGLILHILNTTKYAISVNEMLPAEKQVEVESLIKVCFLHQIGKAKMFVEQQSQWHRDNKGEMFTFNTELLSMTVSERSVYYAMSCGISLSEDEVFAMYNYNDDFSSRPMKSVGEKLAAILRIANLLSVIDEK
jgi:hypothetical protein